MGALAADRQALAVAKAAVGGEVHQALDVHRDFAAEVALDLIVGVDRLADLEDFLVGKVLDPALGRDSELGGDLDRLGAADSVNVGERDHNPLVGGDIHPGNTCHIVFLLLHGAGWLPPHLDASMGPENSDSRRAHESAAGRPVIGMSAR